MSVELPQPLEYLLTCYFHQDWDLEGPTASAVVASFARAEVPEIVQSVHDAAAATAAADASEEELVEALDATGFDYLPGGEGMTYRQFLEMIARETAASGQQRG